MCVYVCVCVCVLSLSLSHAHKHKHTHTHTHTSGPNEGQLADWGASVPCQAGLEADEAIEFLVPVRSGVHIVQVSIYNSEHPDVDYWRRVQQVFEVLSPDVERRILRYREENANLSVPQNRGSIINKIIAARGYRSYLEVGTRFGENYNSVRCQRKESVDPVCVCARARARARAHTHMCASRVWVRASIQEIGSDTIVYTVKCAWQTA